MESRVLYLLGSAAPPVLDIGCVVKDAQQSGWQVCVGLTPTAHDWLGDQAVAALETTTGHVVRVVPRRMGEPPVWPSANVTVIAPATLNTINTCALGLTTNVVTGHVAEALGKRWPLVMMPCVNTAYATNPQFGKSLEVLRQAGVHVLFGPVGFIPNEPGQGRPENYPWHLALQTAERVAANQV
jgi:hypothetical protein